MKTINRTNYYIITIHSLFTNMYLRNFSEKKQKKKEIDVRANTLEINKSGYISHEI